jgi:hypothetical protein
MKYLIILFTLSFSNIILSQVPQKMSYQATIRDASNNLISQKNVGVKISLVKDHPNGNPVFIETHLAVSNLNGLVSIQIGAGFKIFGDFSSINWGDGSYYIKTEIDPDGGYDFKINGTSELLSVPFAFYAEKSKSVFDTTSIYHSIGNLEKQSIENKNNILINIDSIKSSAFKIQKNIDDILLNNKNIQNNVDSLDSKISKIDLDNLLLNYQKLGKFVTAISLLGVDSFDIKINGNLTASKNVTIGGNIEALGTTSTLGTLEKPFKGLFISSGSLSIASDTLGQDIPAAVLSNVRGNLEISAGGLKLVGTDEAFIAPRIVSTLTGNASTASKLDTARKINGIAFDGSKDITIATTASNAITYTNTGTGDVPGGSYNGSLAKTISYNSIGASPLAGSTLITSVGTLAAGAIPFTLLTGTIPIWNQSTLGNAATVTTNANLTGIVTSVGNVTSITSGTITNSMIANSAVANLSGTNTGDQVLPTLTSLGGVATNTAITGATKTKITYDAKGLVTAGADATTADIAAIANKNYVTDVQVGVISNTSGINTGDETSISIKSKLGITSLSGTNTGDQAIPTLESLRRSENESDPYFDERGLLSILTLSSNNSRDQVEEINLSKSIHKLSGIEGRNYILNDGVEGQVIYILPFGDETTTSTIKINIINGTIWNLDKNLLVTSTWEKPIIWTPFSDKRPSVTIGMAIFTENKWFITGGTSNQ